MTKPEPVNCTDCKRSPQMHIGQLNDHFYVCYGCGDSTGVGDPYEPVFTKDEAIDRWNSFQRGKKAAGIRK